MKYKIDERDNGLEIRVDDVAGSRLLTSAEKGIVHVPQKNIRN